MGDKWDRRDSNSKHSLEKQSIEKVVTVPRAIREEREDYYNFITTKKN